MAGKPRYVRLLLPEGHVVKFTVAAAVSLLLDVAFQVLCMYAEDLQAGTYPTTMFARGDTLVFSLWRRYAGPQSVTIDLTALEGVQCS